MPPKGVPLRSVRAATDTRRQATVASAGAPEADGTIHVGFRKLVWRLGAEFAAITAGPTNHVVMALPDGLGYIPATHYAAGMSRIRAHTARCVAIAMVALAVTSSPNIDSTLNQGTSER